jgi:uncharacterized protein (TIGR02145 family)
MKKLSVLLVLAIVSFVLLTTCKKDDDNNNGNGQKNIPVLSTTEITEISYTTAVSGGNITDDGGATVTQRGVCWSTGQTPTINDNKTSDGTGAGSFVSEIKDLEPETNYYVRAYSTNANGTGYGSAMSFTTNDDPNVWNPCPGTPTITDIDGNVYNTVLIGDQCWMKENLNTTKDASGNNITRYCYDDNTTNCELYGGLYTWATVMNGQSSSSSNPSGVKGICPDGWHVPSHHEWTQLEQYICNALGNSNCETQFPYDHSTTGWRGTNEGNALKSCRQVNSPLGGDCNTSEHPRWNSDGTHHGFDEFGFSAFPGGYRSPDGTFDYLGSSGYWWSSTEDSSTNALTRGMYYEYSYVNRVNGSKSFGFSVRCLRD